MSHQRAHSENVTGTQGHTNMVFHKGQGPLQGKGTVTAPGYYGLVNIGDGGRTQCGDAYCHFEGVRKSGDPGRNWKRWWRGLGPFVTNADDSKSVTLTVGGPGRVLQTKGGAVYGLFELVNAVYDGAGTPTVHGDGDSVVYVGRIERTVSLMHWELDNGLRKKRDAPELEPDGAATTGVVPYVAHMEAIGAKRGALLDSYTYEEDAANQQVSTAMGVPVDLLGHSSEWDSMIWEKAQKYMMGESDIRDGVFRVGRVLDGGGKALLVLLAKPIWPAWLADEAISTKAPAA